MPERLRHLKLYLTLVPVFFAVDLLWLGVIAVDFYQAQIGHLLAPEVDWVAAVAFYLLFIGGIQYFGVRPGLASGRIADAALNGGLFGFFTYMTYELTNRATLPAWPLTMVFADTAWGVLLSAVVASIGCWIGLRLGMGPAAETARAGQR
ncbi:MAG: DUF2177 family protein [Thiohalocapsa sp.]|jgi:uncharacterized membrane protein